MLLSLPGINLPFIEFCEDPPNVGPFDKVRELPLPSFNISVIVTLLKLTFPVFLIVIT